MVEVYYLAPNQEEGIAKVILNNWSILATGPAVYREFNDYIISWEGKTRAC